MIRHNNRRGFTLIELMIAVAIISILAAIVYPSYREHIKRSHRSEALVLMQAISASMESYAMIVLAAARGLLLSLHLVWLEMVTLCIYLLIAPLLVVCIIIVQVIEIYQIQMTMVIFLNIINL